MQRFYHISPYPNITTLIPKVPKHFLTEHGHEEGRTPRISLAGSIKSCLRGVGSAKNKVYYVYTPTSINPKYLRKVTRDMVPDSRLTHEWWYLRPLNVKLVAVIKGGEVYDNKVYYVGPLVGVSSGYKYEYLKRYKNGKEIIVKKKLPPAPDKKVGFLLSLFNRAKGIFSNKDR